MNKYVDKYISDINKDLYSNLMNKKYLNDKKLDVINIKDGIIVPPINLKYKKNPSKALFGSGGVIDSNGNYVEESAQKAYGMNNRIYKIDSINDYEIVHEKVIYMNFFIKQWGHFLIDVIGRLWYALIDKETKIVYTCYNNENIEIKGNYLEFLELLGINKDRLIMVNKNTKFDEVIIPESSIYPGSYYTKEYKEIFDVVVGNCLNNSIITNKKIYCSRMLFGKNNKKEFGEEILEENLKSNGYEPVYMEKLSLKEQINLLNSSEYIALTCGSLSHNLLFIRNQNNVFIFNKTYRLNLHQFMVNEISNSNSYFIDIYVSPLPILYGYGPFIIRVTKEFEEFCKDFNINLVNKTKKISFKLRLKYYLIYLISYRKFLIKFKKIRESSNKEFELDFKTIRKYYKKYLKSLK